MINPDSFQGLSGRRENVQTLLDMIHHVPVPMYVIDEHHRVVHWNAACEVLTGVKAEAVMGSDDQWKPFYPEKCYMLADLVLDKMSNNLKNIYIHKDFRATKIIKGAYEAEVFFPDLGSAGTWLLINAAPLKSLDGRIIGAIETLVDMTDKKTLENKLLEMRENLERQVKERTQALMEANVALKVVTKKREKDRVDMGEQMVMNIRETILPYIEKLRRLSKVDQQNILIDIIEMNLKEIVSPLIRNLSESFHKLTPSEIQIINMIKRNKTTKEMAEILNISTRTIETHRDNIRKKLGIKNKKVNLKTYFLSID